MPTVERARPVEHNEGEPHEGGPHEQEDPLSDLHVEGRNNPGRTGAHDPGAQAREQIQDQARDRTAQNTQQNDQLLDDLLNNQHNAEEDADAEDPTATDKPGPFLNKLNPATFAEKAKTITDAYCQKINPDYKSGTKYLRDNGYFISAENAELLLNNPAYSDAVGVLDIRDPNNFKLDLYDRKIPGAMEFPLKEGGDLRLLQLGVHPLKPDNPDRALQWQQEILKDPFKTLILKPVVIIHCRQSANRTPIFASGYIEHVAGPRGQKVVILQGGFEAYADTAKKEHLETRPDPNQVV